MLTPQEIDELIAVMRSLRDEGKAIVFITHKLREVRAIADKITVIRRGKVVGTAQPTDSEAAAGRADGRPGGQPDGGQGAAPTPSAEPRLVLQRRLGGQHRPARWWSTTSTWRWPAARSSASPGCRATGRPSWPRRCSGSSPIDQRHGAARRAADHRHDARSRPSTPGSGFVPEDRKHDGFVGTFTRRREPGPEPLRRAAVRQGHRARPGRIRRERRGPGRRSSTSAPSRSTTPVSSLSGGNQQKVVLARELSRPLSVLIASQPTRGVDVGAIEFLHQRLVDRARPRHGGADRLHRAGRGGRAGRPDRGDVPRQGSSASCRPTPRARCSA